MHQQTSEAQGHDLAFWLRLAATALVVTFPWAFGLVAYGINPAVVMLAVTLSGMAMLLVWDGTRLPRALLGWLRGEPMRDRTTGLFNPDAWEELLGAEEDRCQRYDLPATVVIVKVTPGDRVQLAQLGARIGMGIKRASRKHDVVACLSDDTYAILAVSSKEPNADSLIGRLRSALASQDLVASFSVASRQTSHSLPAAFRDAQRGLVTSG